MTDVSRTTFFLRTVIISGVLVVFSAPYAYAELYRSLDVGARGADVSELQTFLAKDRTLYPEGLVTGYYGLLTQAAVSNFQSRNGIDTVGRVGPITRAALNSQMAGGMSGGIGGGDISAPIIRGIAVNLGTTSASVIWNTNELSRGTVYYSTTPLSIIDNGGTVSVSGIATSTDTSLRISQIVVLSGLQANTTYTYLIHTTDQAGNVSITWPATFKTTN